MPLGFFPHQHQNARTDLKSGPPVLCNNFTASNKSKLFRKTLLLQKYRKIMKRERSKIWLILHQIARELHLKRSTERTQREVLPSKTSLPRKAQDRRRELQAEISTTSAHLPERIDFPPFSQQQIPALILTCIWASSESKIISDTT